MERLAKRCKSYMKKEIPLLHCQPLTTTKPSNKSFPKKAVVDAQAGRRKKAQEKAADAYLFFHLVLSFFSFFFWGSPLALAHLSSPKTAVGGSSRNESLARDDRKSQVFPKDRATKRKICGFFCRSDIFLFFLCPFQPPDAYTFGLKGRL